MLKPIAALSLFGLLLFSTSIAMQKTSFEQLPEEGKRLLKAASEAKENAYNPYSGFYVGTALLTKDDKIITGCNFENASYGCCICAERAALLKANSDGKRQFKAVAIVARGKDFDTQEVTAPCGACRQMLFEASQLSNCNLTLYLATTKFDKIVISSIEELLPLGFGPKDLGVDISPYTEPAKE